MDSMSYYAAAVLYVGFPSSYLTAPICEEWFRTSALFLMWDTMKVLTIHRNKIQLKLDNLFTRWGTFMNECQFIDHAVAMHLQGETGEVTVVSQEIKI
jgi:hypothetical protein